MPRLPQFRLVHSTTILAVFLAFSLFSRAATAGATIHHLVTLGAVDSDNLTFLSTWLSINMNGSPILPPEWGEGTMALSKYYQIHPSVEMGCLGFFSDTGLSPCTSYPGVPFPGCNAVDGDTCGGGAAP